MALVSGDDEFGFCGERTGENVIVIRVVARWGGQRLRVDDLGQAFIGLHELGGGKPRGAHPLSELIAGDNLGELSQQRQTRIERDLAFTGEIEQAARRPLSAVTVSGGTVIKISDGRAPSTFAATAPGYSGVGVGAADQRAAAARRGV